MTSDFEKRRFEFGKQLRTLLGREQFKDFAARLGWNASKVSKIATGKQTPSDADLAAWLRAVNAPRSLVAKLTVELTDLQLEQVEWRAELRAGHRARQEDLSRSEARAELIRAVDIMCVPGLLRTADYARAIFATQADLLEVPSGDLDDAVRARLRRQQVLYSGQRVEILFAQASLANPVCSADQMRVQVDRVLSLIGLPNVRLGIIPLWRTLPNLLPHGFWVIDDVVLVETVTAEHRITDPEQVAVYNRLTDRLWDSAAEDDAARAVLAETSAHWGLG
ncbi:helix-turn-helix transcriptional regulator [Allokutzneria sp. NRRL B-24872]|uniref:helix-turn-helix domain-containing protein n=1 Tax=Allokutzneria sp. NRRL B-24872 TaxID=1137961 RepID=UPI00143D326B|nr:helix-turn-helix transcriptional regulator [Allokutzneria sp. NRRL B-24872]